MSVTEGQLDKALEAAFKNSPEFVSWFINQIGCSNSPAKYCWSRSDNPWGKFPAPLEDPATGQEHIEYRESETDVLVVFELANGERFGVHIENKLASGKFEELQPEQYSVRAAAWLNNPKYGSYSSYKIVLVAPKIFVTRNLARTEHFDSVITHESIAIHLPLFRQSAPDA